MAINQPTFFDEAMFGFNPDYGQTTFMPIMDQPTTFLEDGLAAAQNQRRDEHDVLRRYLYGYTDKPVEPEQIADTSRTKALIGGAATGTGALLGSTTALRILQRIAESAAKKGKKPRGGVGGALLSGAVGLGGALVGGWAAEKLKGEAAKSTGVVGRWVQNLIASEQQYPYTAMAGTAIPSVPMAARSIGRSLSNLDWAKRAGPAAYQAALGEEAKRAGAAALGGAGVSLGVQAGLGAVQGAPADEWISPMGTALDVGLAAISPRAHMGRAEKGRFYNELIQHVRRAEESGKATAAMDRMRLMKMIYQDPDVGATYRQAAGQFERGEPLIEPTPGEPSPIIPGWLERGVLDEESSMWRSMEDLYGREKMAAVRAKHNLMAGSNARAYSEVEPLKDMVFGHGWTRHLWKIPGMGEALQKMGYVRPLEGRAKEALENVAMAQSDMAATERAMGRQVADAKKELDILEKKFTAAKDRVNHEMDQRAQIASRGVDAINRIAAGVGLRADMALDSAVKAEATKAMKEIKMVLEMAEQGLTPKQHQQLKRDLQSTITLFAKPIAKGEDVIERLNVLKAMQLDRMDKAQQVIAAFRNRQVKRLERAYTEKVQALERRLAAEDFQRPIGAFRPPGKKVQEQTLETAQKILAEEMSAPIPGYGDFPQRVGALKAGYDRLLYRAAEAGIETTEFRDKLLKIPFYQPEKYLDDLGGLFRDNSILDSNRQALDTGASFFKYLDKGSLSAAETDSERLLLGANLGLEHRIARNEANLELVKLVQANPSIPGMREYRGGFRRVARADGLTYLEPKQALRKDEAIITARIVGQKKVKGAMVDAPQTVGVVVPMEFAKLWGEIPPSIAPELSNQLQIWTGSKLLKAMATGVNPVFAIANVMRDVFHVWGVTNLYNSGSVSKVLPIAGFAELGRDMAETLGDAISIARRKPTARAKEFIRHGAASEYLSKESRPHFATPELDGIARAMGWLGEVSENWTRLAAFNRGMKLGLGPVMAADQARGYIDFSKGGTWTKFASAVGIPYVNASMQGARGWVTAAEKSPGMLAWKLANVGTVAAGLTIANLIYNRECYDAIPENEKTDNWIITTPFFEIDPKTGEKRYTYFRIPLDQTIAPVKSLWESLARKSLTGQAPPRPFMESIRSLKTSLPMTDMSAIMPPVMESVLGYTLNHNFWQDDTIWRGASVRPEDEVIPGITRQMAVDMGKGLSMSPARLDYAINAIAPRNVWTALVNSGWKTMISKLPPEEQAKMNSAVVDGLKEIEKSAKSRFMRQTYLHPKDVVFEAQDMLEQNYNSARRHIIEQMQRWPDVTPEEIARSAQDEATKLHEQAKGILKPLATQLGPEKAQEAILPLIMRYTIQPDDLNRMITDAAEKNKEIDPVMFRRMLGVPEPRRRMRIPSLRAQMSRLAELRERQALAQSMAGQGEHTYGSQD
jgi:hypothetical protein